MEDSTNIGVGNASQTSSRIPLGMSSFGVQERNEFGQGMRLAMACIEGREKPTNSKAIPSDAIAINKRLVALSQDFTSHHADLLELLVRFDELEGWKVTGAKHCMAWMNLELGISMKLGYEYLRVGRELRSLPITMALFRAGKLSWSKVRLISRVADSACEKVLCHAALDASVTDVERLCAEYRWKTENGGNADTDNDRYLQQFESRSLSHAKLSDGSTLIRLRLPPDLAQAYLNSIEHSLSRLEETENTISQRRADAAVLMAEASLQHAGRDIATADRYQVIVSVDANSLQRPVTQAASTNREKKHQNEQHNDQDNIRKNGPESTEQYEHGHPSKKLHHIPTKRPTIKSAGPVARETARRIACDCSVTSNIVSNGEPTDIGRRSRLWPAAMSRAIKNRDQHCQWPGCNQSHNLQIHHIKHWADGGTTCVANGCSLCQTHHTAVHEGGFVIQRVSDHDQRMDEQFRNQRHDSDITQFDFEREIRVNRDSFDIIRRLSPTRFRFRVVDSQGRNIRENDNNLPATVNCKNDASMTSSLDINKVVPIGITNTNKPYLSDHTDHTDHTNTTNTTNTTDHRSQSAKYSTYVDTNQPSSIVPSTGINSLAINPINIADTQCGSELRHAKSLYKTPCRSDISDTSKCSEPIPAYVIANSIDNTDNQNLQPVRALIN